MCVYMSVCVCFESRKKKNDSYGLTPVNYKCHFKADRSQLAVEQAITKFYKAKSILFEMIQTSHNMDNN